MNNLIKFLAQHSISAHPTADGKISALATYCKDGQAFQQWETLEPNVLAVRDWLGY